jgi:hypothetical protein
VETGGTIVEVERQQQDKRMMTNSAGWVQNRGQYNGAGGQATARRQKVRVERRPFLAPEVVIFGVDFTGPYILVVIIQTDPTYVTSTSSTNHIITELLINCLKTYFY